jgi:putative ABC transport system permease protein
MAPLLKRVAALYPRFAAQDAQSDLRGAEINTFSQDVRYGIRVLRKDPRFAAAAILTLAVGIGANTAIFSVVNSVLLRPLAFADSSRLVRLYTHDQTRENLGLTFLDFIDVRERAHAFRGLAASWENDANLFDQNGPQKIRAAFATADLFPLLGVQPRLGRLFRPADDRVGYEPIAVISYGLWQRRYGGDPSIVGRSIEVDSSPYTVVGVLPRGFHYPGETDLWMPMGVGEKFLTSLHFERRNHAMDVVARLQPGVRLDQANAEMSVLMDQLAQEHPTTDAGWHALLVPLEEDTIGAARKGLWTLMGAAGFVLLIGCANLASLVLARGTARTKEFAIRGALGGSRSRLARQILTENILLSLAGGIVGGILSYFSFNLILGIIPHDLPRLDEVRFDARAFAFAFGLSLLSGIVFGWVPALQAGKVDLQTSLKPGGRDSAGDSNPRLRKLLIVGEVACAFILLAGASLLMRSFVRLLQVQPGFNPRNVMTATIGFPDSYPSEKEQIRFSKQVIANLRSAPGVRDVAATSLLPLVNFKRAYVELHLAGEPDDPGHAHEANTTVVTPDFFRVMQIPLVTGRVFLDSDASLQSGALVISQTAARSFWPGQNPIGRHLKFYWAGGAQDREVVGVVADVKQTSLAAASAPEMYVPFYGVGYTYLTFLVRTESSPEPFASTLVDQVQKADRMMAVYDVRSAEQLMSESLSASRSYLWLIGVFGLTALALSAIGIFGVISFSVAQRTSEFGIRLALGALPGHLLRMILGEGLRLTLAGIGLGIVGSIALTRLISNLLFGVTPTDPITLAVVCIILALCALAASIVPARRAMTLDPIVALRNE